MPTSPGSIAVLIAIASLLVLLSAAAVLIPVPPSIGAAPAAPAEGFAVAEGFADPVKMRPCAVYYTENIAACDHPAALYEKSMSWRKIRLDQLNALRTPTTAETEERNLLSQIAAEETQKRGNIPRFCKVSFPGFSEIADDPRKLQSQAKTRGPAEHWAFCYKANPDAASAEVSAVAFGDRSSVYANKDTVTNMGDNNVYSRIQFRNLDFGEVKSAMCIGPRPTELVLSQNLPVLLALDIDPYTMQLKSIGAAQRGGKGALVPYDNWLALFGRLFRAKGANYQYLMTPFSMAATVYMISKNICDEETFQGTYPITINLASAGVGDKAIAEGMPYPSPSRAAMVEGISEIQGKINEANATIADLTAKYNTVTSSAGGGLNRLVYLINRPDHWPQNTDQMNALFANRLRLVKQDIDSKINYRSDTRVPGVREGYAIEWRGLIKAPASGTYWFNMNSDDAADAYVNDTLVTTYYGGHWFNKQGVSVTGIRLEAGAFYPIKIRMMEWWGDDGMELSVRSDAPGVGNTWQMLPASWCYYSSDPNLYTYVAKIEYARLQAQTLSQRKAEYEHWIAKISANQAGIVKSFADDLIGKNVSGVFQRSYISDDNKIYVDVGAYISGQDTASQEIQGNSETQQVLLGSAIELASARTIASPYVPLHKTPVYSVSMWIKVLAGSTSWRNVLFYGAEDDWTNWTTRKNNNPLIDRTPGFWIYPDNTTRLHYRHRALTADGFNDGIDVTDTSVLPPFGAWFHYCTTISGNQAKSYVNGRLVASRTLPGNFEWNDMKPKTLRLGKDGISAGVYLQKLYWYNRVLADAEVAALAREVTGSYTTGRYVRLQRKTWPPGGQAQGYLNILEFTAYGTNDQRLSASPSLWPQYGGTGSFGPRFLTDNNIRADWWNSGGGGLPHTTNHPSSYMELDLGRAQEIKRIVIENRRDCCTSRIIGTELQVLDASRRVLWSRMIQTDLPTYNYSPQLN